MALLGKIKSSSLTDRGVILIAIRSSPTEQEELNQIIDQGIAKEISASQGLSYDSPRINYGFLRGTVDYASFPRWIQDVGRLLAREFHGSLSRAVLFPQVNRSKNIGRESARLYNLHMSKALHEVTTNDLEMLYFRTGIKIPGPCELRTSFKFNDTKPRVYYAQGGTAYFQSRFIKDIAVRMMESIWSTQEIHRRRPVEYLNHGWYDWDSYEAMYWDLSSFTTRLGEIRFFIHQFVTELRRIGNIYIKTFDRNGTTKTNLCDMLDEYNLAMNYNPEFSFERLVNADILEEPVLVSRQGGLLGVPGNIGMSTFFHGVIAERIAGTGNTICVGDDAIAVGLTQSRFNLLQSSIQEIGSIPQDKFGFVSLQASGRFLKRSIEINQNDGLVLHQYLPSFPAIPEIYGIKIPGRTIPERDLYQRAKLACVNAGSILWSFKSHWDMVSDEDIKAFNRFFKRVYRHFQFSFAGGLPGTQSILEKNNKPQPVQFWIPPLPIDYDPRILDWAEYLIDRRRSRYITLPKVVEKSYRLPEQGFKGEDYYCTGGPFLNFLEDHGWCTKETIFESVDLGLDINRRTLLKFLKEKKLKKLYLVTLRRSLTDLDLNLSDVTDPPLPYVWDGDLGDS